MVLNKNSLANLKPPVKGEIRNPKGKAVGTLSTVNKKTKELLAQAAQDNLPAVNEAIDKLLKSQNEIVRGRAVELYLRLLEFSQPRLSAMAVKGDGVGAGIIVIGKPAELDSPSEEDQFIDTVAESSEYTNSDTTQYSSNDVEDATVIVEPNTKDIEDGTV